MIEQDNMQKSTSLPAAFGAYERHISWRYLRAARAESGVSLLTWISIIGIALAVFALVATLAVRSGFRAEFVDTVLGANAHVTVYNQAVRLPNGQISREITEFDALRDKIKVVEGVSRVAPLVKGTVMATHAGRYTGVQVYGMRYDDLLGVPRVAQPESSIGLISDYEAGIALGSGVARELGVGVGDQIKLMSPDGAMTPMGRSPRVKSFVVAYIFQAGRYDIDNTRTYLPLAAAQSFFNREGVVDEMEVMVHDPEAIEELLPSLLEVTPPQALLWTWKDASGNILRALTMEDNVMFILLSILVLVASMIIISGIIMLVQNKTRDIAILRTMGVSQGTILRVFFMCGSLLGLIGAAVGTVLGVLFVVYLDPIFELVNFLAGGGVWDASVRGIYEIPALLRWQDVVKANLLALIMSCGVTIFPALRAARLDPVEGLRHE